MGLMLAVPGLVLVFTYADVVSRAGPGKQAEQREANAIGTAFLRPGACGGVVHRHRL